MKVASRWIQDGGITPYAKKDVEAFTTVPI